MQPSRVGCSQGESWTMPIKSFSKCTHALTYTIILQQISKHFSIVWSQKFVVQGHGILQCLIYAIVFESRGTCKIWFTDVLLGVSYGCLPTCSSQDAAGPLFGLVSGVGPLHLSEAILATILPLCVCISSFFYLSCFCCSFSSHTEGLPFPGISIRCYVTTQVRLFRNLRPVHLICATPELHSSGPSITQPSPFLFNKKLESFFPSLILSDPLQKNCLINFLSFSKSYSRCWSSCSVRSSKPVSKHHGEHISLPCDINKYVSAFFSVISYHFAMYISPMTSLNGRGLLSVHQLHGTVLSESIACLWLPTCPPLPPTFITWPSDSAERSNTL